MAACLLLALAVVVARDPMVERTPVQVSVPREPGSAEQLLIDAMVYVVAGQDDPSPALLLAHGFGSDRTSLDGLAQAWARRGYTVLTWSARGFGASEGQITLDNPNREIADISRLIDVLAERDDVISDGAGDPLVGIAGGSYGGGAALLAAIQEPRLDAVVAVAAWNDLPQALAPNRSGGDGVPKSQWLSLLFAAGSPGSPGSPGTGSPDGQAAPDQGADVVVPDVQAFEDPDVLACGRFALPVCAAYQDSARGDRLTDEAGVLLAQSSPAGRLGSVSAPTMLIHGLDDTLFDLGQSLDNARELAQTDTPTTLRWIDAGHTGLGEAGTAADELAQEWLDRWLHSDGGDVSASPAAFAWTDIASGEVQLSTSLPAEGPATAEFTLDLRPTPDGRLATGDGTDDSGAQSEPGVPGVALLHPAGGLPAALSTLPGLGNLGGLLPTVDVPGQSLTFETEAVDADVTLLGRPQLTLDPSGASPDGSDGLDPAVFIKLFDVSPGGTARLLQSDVNPVRLTGQAQVTLGPLAHRIVAGNRLRLVVATTDQGFDTGVDAQAVVVPLGPEGSLVLPLADTAVTNPLPAAVRILIPVLLVVVMALLAGWLMRRRDAGLAVGTPVVDAPPVQIRALEKHYADGKVAVDGVDLTVERGQVFGLLGPNGAGKTTTMRMLLGLIQPTSGTVEILGHPVVSGHPLFHRVGVLVEGPGFAPYLTGRQNLESYWRAGGQPLADANLDRALDVADLGPAIDRPTKTYSHGMRQRLAIAQALLGDPELLVLDEPTDGLDPEQIRGMRELLARLGRDGITVLVSSHLLAEVEQMCTHVAVMQAGRVLASGAVAELMGATRSIVIGVADQAQARAALADLLAEDQMGVEGGGLVITLGDVTTAEVVAALVAHGVAVSSVTPRGRLEDTFLALTGAEPVARDVQSGASA